MENKNAQPTGDSPGMGDVAMAMAKAAAIESILRWQREQTSPKECNDAVTLVADKPRV